MKVSEVVKLAINSIITNNPNRKVDIVIGENLHDYIVLSEYIMRKHREKSLEMRTLVIL